jgi:hypothetical protein
MNAADAGAVEAIARRVVELLRGEDLGAPSPRFVDAATLAKELSVERDWVYAHAEDLGAVRLGGPRGRLRFDREVARARLRRQGTAEKPPRSATKAKKSPRHAKVKSPEIQRRASGRTPARSPKQQHPGGSPNDEA